jgi:twitching motility protein PilJ
VAGDGGMKFLKSNKPGSIGIINLGNIRITQKLMGLLAGLLIGFIIIGAAYYKVLDTQSRAATVSNKMTQFENGIHEVQVDLLNARRSESEFYLKKYPIFLGNFDTRIVVASQNLKALTSLVKDEDELKIITQLGKAFEIYREKFIRAAETQVDIGLDDNTGLNKDLVKIADLLTKLVDKTGSIDMERSTTRMSQLRNLFVTREDVKYADNIVKELNGLRALTERATMSADAKIDMRKYLDEYRQLIDKQIVLVSQLNIQKTEVKQSVKNIEPLFDELLSSSNHIIQKARDQAAEQQRDITLFFILTLIVTAAAVSVSLFVFARSIINPMRILQDTVIKVNDGDLNARTNLNRSDELGELANAFDKLLDEKLANLALAEKESESLNESVIQMIRYVSKLAQGKDLAVKIPVSEDITGAIGDSLNFLAKETAKILGEVKNTSNKVADISSVVKAHADHIISVANSERVEVEATANMLRESVDAMNIIAMDAQNASKQADKTILNTQNALDAVISSVDGINSIRAVISETEKRIKRLGERSQEITGIVNLINSIAERTHILALNASMHAASAGEAGRGFAVVADEVQRLAENARQATSEISTLVNNIRIETSDAVSTMNTVISQVAEEIRLAEQARRSMKETQTATSDLVGFVQHIASSSMLHADLSKQLLTRAKQIQDNSEQTGRELFEQTRHTDTLVKYSRDLVASVGVFKLPGDIREEKVVDLDDDADDDVARLRAAG